MKYQNSGLAALVLLFVISLTSAKIDRLISSVLVLIVGCRLRTVILSGCSEVARILQPRFDCLLKVSAIKMGRQVENILPWREMKRGTGEWRLGTRTNENLSLVMTQVLPVTAADFLARCGHRTWSAISVLLTRNIRDKQILDRQEWGGQVGEILS